MKTIFYSLFFFSLLSVTSFGQTGQSKKSHSKILKSNTGYYPKMDEYLVDVISNFKSIPKQRKKILKNFAKDIRTKANSSEALNMVFICTHNSRRSHISQLWASVAADYYDVKNFKGYSGGTEATAFNPRAVAALERAGFQIIKTSDEKNPKYEVSFGESKPKLSAFSKKYSDPTNPADNFIAVMTCTNADKNCPIVQGAYLRVALPFEDPKVSDDTEKEVSTYDQRAFQIATELFFLFSLLKK